LVVKPRIIAGTFGCLVLTACVYAQNQPTTGSIGDLSLEDLMNVTVTSVSKKEEKLADAAAAIFVLSNDDLRRSGATSLPEALRLVPGLDVGAINSSQWAITARGFNGIYANKLLVLIDGRAVYEPLASGVYWDAQQVMLEDVDRIEVIRGPGAAIWGANAVNGVINVVTRTAKETQGTFMYGGGGDVHQAMVGARYGGRIGDNTFYRMYGSYGSDAHFLLANGHSARDGWQRSQGGFRVDRYPQPGTHLTWQGDATTSDLADHASDAYNLNTLVRWTREFSSRSSIEVQAYYNQIYRNETTLSRKKANTFDYTLQQTVGLAERNDLIWGVGYRFIGDTIEQVVPDAPVRNGEIGLHLFSAFVQDELKLVPGKLLLTIGTKVEHNGFTGFEVQPSVRAAFKPVARQTVWTAVSRAVRTPSEIEGKDIFAIAIGPPFPGPGGALYLPTLVGNANPVSEVLWAYEAGYRIQPVGRINIDIAAFYNRYSDIITPGILTRFIPGVPFGMAEIPFANTQSGRTYGGEVSVTVEPADNWRLMAGYSPLRRDIHGVGAVANADPQQKATLRSSYDLRGRATLDVQLFFGGAFVDVPSHTTTAVRFSYRLTDKLELSLVGQNLSHDHHTEQSPSQTLALGAEVPRGVYSKLAWRF
jgi:iron complex outermembrane receptor protein